MNRRFEGKRWSVLLPEGWNGRHDPECTTLFADGGAGALQLSTAFKDSEVTDADLREFASDHLDAGARPRLIEFGDYSGFGLTFDRDELCWSTWYLRHGPQVLFVTYACALEDRGLEDGAVLLILSTLSATGESSD